MKSSCEDSKEFLQPKCAEQLSGNRSEHYIRNPEKGRGNNRRDLQKSWRMARYNPAPVPPIGPKARWNLKTRKESQESE